MRKVPTLDYSLNNSDPDLFSEKLFQALKDYGFVVLKNHPVDNDLIKNAYSLLNDFFIKSNEHKSKFMGETRQTGFIPFGLEHAKDKSPDLYDLKEFWQTSRVHFEKEKDDKYFPKNVLLDDNNFNDTIHKLYGEFDCLSRALLGSIGRSLNIEKGTLEKLVVDGNSILRGIHYPPLDGMTVEGHVRAAAHEDINLITIMPGASDNGLEILDHDGNWLPVEANYDYLIVDTGDMLSRITNDMLPATTHRVVNPKDLSVRRLSLPFFVHPHPDATLKGLDNCGESKYEEITSNDFLQERLKEIGLKK